PSSFAACNRAAISTSVSWRSGASGAGRRGDSAASRGRCAVNASRVSGWGQKGWKKGGSGAGSRRAKNSMNRTAKIPRTSDAPAHRLGRRIQVQILRRETKLELVQLLAQLRAAFLDVRECRIVLGPAKHLAGRNGVAHRTEVAFGGRHVGVCIIERLTETLHG